MKRPDLCCTRGTGLRSVSSDGGGEESGGREDVGGELVLETPWKLELRVGQGVLWGEMGGEQRPRQKEQQRFEERPLQVRMAFPHVQGPGPMPRAGPPAQVLLEAGELWSCHLPGRPWGLDDPVPRCPLCSGHKVASSSLQSLTSSRPGLRDLASWAWTGRPSSFGPPGCSQDGPPPCLSLCQCGRQGREKLCGHHQLYSPMLGQAPGLCWRAAMLVGVATALP